MTKHVMIILVGMRNDAAEKVQKILTGWGCFIKTRLGLHEDVLENCTQTGLIFLELVGEKEKLQEMERKLNLIPSVDAQLMTLTISDKD
ncbi:MAG: hypothetical protein IPM52_06175 [Bacteroidetes bacterium]|nr:hypothetical protein [Bacteroidota bacterium]